MKRHTMDDTLCQTATCSLNNSRTELLMVTKVPSLTPVTLYTCLKAAADADDQGGKRHGILIATKDETVLYISH